jgi:colanic acid/amylovoran biosynthesis protein
VTARIGPAADPIAPAPAAPRPQAAPRVFLDTSDYRLENFGDIAMLRTAVWRLGEVTGAPPWVLTQDQESLARLCPGADAVSWEARRLWLAENEPFGRLTRRTPRALRTPLRRARARWRAHAPRLLGRALRAGAEGREREELDRFFGAFYGAGAVAVSGAGGITDHAARWCVPVLETLEVAARRGIPTALFSHGLGPLTDPALIRLARRVLPSLSVIALREGRHGPARLSELGVRGPAVVVTGDDALELAYEAAPQVPGESLGVNVRISPSAGFDAGLIGELRPLVAAFVCFRRADARAIAIARQEGSTPQGEFLSDYRAIAQVLDGLRPEESASADSLEEILGRIGACRVLLTGAYHAAVFALAQGIPAVCLAGSDYFEQKLSGLADAFGQACRVIRVRGALPAAELQGALSELWEAAPQIREPARERASQQIARSREAYRLFAQQIPGARREAM